MSKYAYKIRQFIQMQIPLNHEDVEQSLQLWRLNPVASEIFAENHLFEATCKLFSGHCLVIRMNAISHEPRELNADQLPKVRDA